MLIILTYLNFSHFHRMSIALSMFTLLFWYLYFSLRSVYFLITESVTWGTLSVSTVHTLLVYMTDKVSLNIFHELFCLIMFMSTQETDMLLTKLRDDLLTNQRWKVTDDCCSSCSNLCDSIGNITFLCRFIYIFMCHVKKSCPLNAIWASVSFHNLKLNLLRNTLPW